MIVVDDCCRWLLLMIVVDDCCWWLLLMIVVDDCCWSQKADWDSVPYVKHHLSCLKLYIPIIYKPFQRITKCCCFWTVNTKLTRLSIKSILVFSDTLDHVAETIQSYVSIYTHFMKELTKYVLVKRNLKVYLFWTILSQLSILCTVNIVLLVYLENDKCCWCLIHTICGITRG